MWKLTALAYATIILVWTTIDWRDHPGHPWRHALWLSPVLVWGWIVVLLASGR